MVADNFCNQGKAETAAAVFCGDKGIEQMRHQVFRHAGAIILDANFKWQRNACFAARYGKPHARAKCRRELYFPIVRVFADRLGRILQEIKKYLNKLVAIGQNWRQGRIVFFGEFDVPCKARLGQSFNVIQNRREY